MVARFNCSVLLAGLAGLAACTAVATADEPVSDPEMDEMILTHLEASGHHEAAAAFRKSSGMPAAAGTPPPPLPSSAGTCPPTMDHFNGEKLMHNAVLTATAIDILKEDMVEEEKMKYDQFTEGVRKFHSQRRQFLQDLSQHVVRMRSVNQGLAYKYAGHGIDEESVKHHIISLQNTKDYFHIGMDARPDLKKSAGTRRWWNDEFAQAALQSITAVQLVNGVKDGSIKDFDRKVEVRDVDIGALAAAATSPGTQAAADRVLLKSGFPLHLYQSEALKLMPPRAPNQGVAHLPADVSVDEVYKLVEAGRPFVIAKGLLDDWPAVRRWTKEGLLKNYGDIKLKVAKGPKPGYDRLAVDYKDEQGNGADDFADEEDSTDGFESTYDAAVARYARFEASIAEKEKDGYTYDKVAMKLKRGEESITVMPPEKPDAKPKPGATTTLGKQSIMTIAEFINQVLDPADVSAFNTSHIEQRYVFNTMQNSSLAADFKVPDLIQAIANKREGAFGSVIHGGNMDYNEDGTFEFFFGGAGSGAYLHAHNAAWNGLVYGRKRWLILTPGKLQDSHELPAGQVPAFEWFRDSSPIWREKLEGHIIEFTQEEGEVVYVPDTWGHAILNLEPCIGVSKQVGIFSWPDGVPKSVLDLMDQPPVVYE